MHFASSNVRADFTARPHELTAVVNRQVFEQPPGDVTAPADVARWRAFRAAYARAQALSDVSLFPLQLDFELNSTCNLRCAFCLHGHQRIISRSLPIETFQRVIDEGEHHGLCSIKLNYINEPLMRRDLAEHVRYAKAHGVLNVYFATNGVLLDDATARALIEARLSKIMVSLDAATPDTFQRMRRSEHFDRIVANLRHLLALRREYGVTYPLVRVNFLKTRDNMAEAEAFIAQWAGVADALGFQDRVGVPGVEEAVTDPETEVYQERGFFRCAFPYKLLVIDSAGHILPCCTFNGRDMPLGHVDELTIADAWASLRLHALRQLHQRGGYRENPVCTHCIHGIKEATR